MFQFDRKPLYPHQIEDLPFLEDTPRAALFWEQGLAKSRQVVEHVNLMPKIKTVLILAPAMCRSVWESLDPEDPSELLKYSDREFNLVAYNRPQRRWKLDALGLTVVVASVECLVYDRHLRYLRELVQSCQPELIVGDESSYFKNPTAPRTRAVQKLFASVPRRIILNGTPVANNELDLYSQYAALDPNILGYKSYFHFKAKHAQMGGWQNRQVVKVINTDVITRRTAPYTRRRLKKDHLQSLPEKLYLSPLEVPLQPSTWKMYKEMRDDLVTWLDQQPAVVTNGAVKVLRLAQLTSGFLGGVADQEGLLCQAREVSSEKTEAVVDLLDERRDAGEGMQILWVRFVPEVARLGRLLAVRGWDVFHLHGQATEEQRRTAKRVFQYGAPRPSVLLANQGSAGFGLTLVAAHEARYVSQDFSQFKRAQSEDRTHRGGQGFQCVYQDVRATGPDGQKTVDHQIGKALANKQSIACLTSVEWIRLLREE